MPTVPRMTGQRVSTAPLPGVRIGGQQPSPGLDLTPVMRLAAGIYEAERQKADEVAFLDADNQLATIETDLRGLAAQKRGKDAMGATAEVEAEWKKRTSEVEASLSNDRQKAAYRRRVGARWQGLYSAVEAHGRGEAEKYEDQTFKAALDNRVNDAVEAAFDPARREQAAQEATALINSYAKQRGLPPEARDEQIAAWQSRIHTGVLNRMIATGDDRTASAYYAEVKGEVRGTDKAAVERVLEEGSTLGESQRKADAILATPGITRTEAYEKAREETDPKLRKAITAELRGRYGLQDEADESERRALIETAYTAMYEKRRPSPTILAQLPVSDRMKVLSFWEQSQKGDPIETNWATYVELKEMAVRDPTRFKQLNPLDYRSKLGDTEFKQFVDWHTARKAGRNADDLNGYLTVTEQVNLALKATDLSNKPDDDEQVVRFKMAANQRVADWQRDHDQKSIPPEELQKITDRMVRDSVNVNTRLGARAFPAFGKGAPDKEQRQRSAVPYKEIPVEEVDAIRELFRQRGKRSNTALIERAYAADRLGDYALMQSIIQGAP